MTTSTKPQEKIPDLIGFIHAVMRPWPESCADAGELQEIAEKHGILIPETRHSFCDKDEDSDAGACPCREVCDAIDLTRGFQCYRQADLSTALVMPKAEVEGVRVTDEMVERINLVYFKRAASGGTNIECMRAALTAALGNGGKGC